MRSFDKEIDQLIEKILSMKELFGLSMQPEQEKINGTGVLSDPNIINRWLLQSD